MTSDRTKLDARVVTAAEAALTDHGYVSAVDVFIGIGWLVPTLLKEWRTGRIQCLESTLQTNPARIAEAMRALSRWATERKLLPSETAYIARTPGREELRFSMSGDPGIERAYRTHWMSPELSRRQHERREREASAPPELVVIDPLDDAWTCHRCNGSGAFLIMEPPGPACLACANLDHLEFLPSGVAALTRRAKSKSTVHAVVVRFSRARKRYERQGLLVDPKALREAKRELGII